MAHITEIAAPPSPVFSALQVEAAKRAGTAIGAMVLRLLGFVVAVTLPVIVVAFAAVALGA